MYVSVYVYIQHLQVYIYKLFLLEETRASTPDEM